MSNAALSQAWLVPLSPSDKLVLLSLADHADKKGKAWPAVARIVERTGLGERTVRRSLQALIAAGHITQQLRRAKSPMYTVKPCQSDTPANAAPLPQRQSRPANAAPKPSRTTNAEEANASPAAPARNRRPSFPPPEGVGAEQWAAFCKQRKKALSDASYALVLKKLLTFAGEGFPPGELIDLAIERGWETVFKPRNDERDRSGSRNTDAYRAAMHGVDPASAF